MLDILNTRNERYFLRNPTTIFHQCIVSLKSLANTRAYSYEKELKTARALGIRKAFVLALFAALPLFLMFAAMAVSFWYANYNINPGRYPEWNRVAFKVRYHAGHGWYNDAGNNLRCFLGCFDRYSTIRRRHSADGSTCRSKVGSCWYFCCHWQGKMLFSQ